MLLSKYLEEKEITKRTFATELGISPGHACDIANGVTPPSFRLARKIVLWSAGCVRLEELYEAVPEGGAQE